MGIFTKTSDYELFKSSKDLKRLLVDISSAVSEVNGRPNPYFGSINIENNFVKLTLKNQKIPLKKYSIELRESDKQVWARIKVSPTTTAILIEVGIIALAIAAYSGLSLPAFVIPISIILPYFHFLSYNKDTQILGQMLDPIYFNSPMALAKTQGGLLSSMNSFLIPYYVLCILFIIGYFVNVYFKLFTF